MKEVKRDLKAHRQLQKAAFRGKQTKFVERRAALKASRKKLQTLFMREEALEDRLMEKLEKTKEKGAHVKSNGVAPHRADSHAS